MHDSSAQIRRPDRSSPADRLDAAGCEAFAVTIQLFVDATDVRRGILGVREIIHMPHGGPLRLLYPEWLPGYHAPEAPLESVAGLYFHAGGQSLSWRRDAVRMHAFHLELPEKTQSLEIGFQLLTPTASEQGRIGVTAQQLNLQWNTVLFYPAGYRFDQIGVRGEVTLPDGWQQACALAHEQFGSRIDFALAALDIFVDSPLFAGRNYFRYPIEDRIALHVFGDRKSQTQVDDQAQTQIRAMVAEADQLFGARPFDHYDFLISISEELGDLGVEHHRSAELVLPPNFFTQWTETSSRNDVLAHEYAHAWNGKFRRGEGACTTSFDQPIRGDLLWVYEGLTQYWGQVLATRAGLWDAELFRGALALTAARCCNMKGRRWRPLRDTTRDPVLTVRRELTWESWQRDQDYYTDGQLLWLEVDIWLRQQSQEKRSLDDFGRMFFGMGTGHTQTLPYRLEDIVETLNDIVARDWAVFFDKWLNACSPAVPLDGITQGGYALAYRAKRSGFHRQTDELSGLIDLTFSAGFSASPDGKVKEVIWESPAFHAGLTAGAEILAVNDKPFSKDDLCTAVAETVNTGAITLWAKKLKHCETLHIAYGGGHHFPHLERLAGQPFLLDAIVRPHR
jgi:predicted metalloprotease with PDZ domain